jgi:hypothetical protein
MATQTAAKTGLVPKLSPNLEQKLRELYANAPQTSKAALENMIRELKSGAPAKVTCPVSSDHG